MTWCTLSSNHWRLLICPSHKRLGSRQKEITKSGDRICGLVSQAYGSCYQHNWSYFYAMSNPKLSRWTKKTTMFSDTSSLLTQSSKSLKCQPELLGSHAATFSCSFVVFCLNNHPFLTDEHACNKDAFVACECICKPQLFSWNKTFGALDGWQNIVSCKMFRPFVMENIYFLRTKIESKTQRYPRKEAFRCCWCFVKTDVGSFSCVSATISLSSASWSQFTR